MKKRISLKRSIAGFTLIEALVVMIMAGILFAIAAPSWVGFLNRQRLSTARGQVFEILRSAQADAKRTKVGRAVFFDNNDSEKKPRVIVIPYKNATVNADGSVNADGTPPPSTDNGGWQVLGNGDIKPGVIKIAGKPGSATETTSGKIVFDTYGNVEQNAVTLPYTITVQTTGPTSPKRCVKVTTLLGAMTSAEDSGCNNN